MIRSMKAWVPVAVAIGALWCAVDIAHAGRGCGGGGYGASDGGGCGTIYRNPPVQSPYYPNWHPGPNGNQSQLPPQNPTDDQTQNTEAPQARPSDPPPTASAATHLGAWEAKISERVTVHLLLRDGGRFSWLATNGSGESVSFHGRFAVRGGVLAMVSNDGNRVLKGKATASGRNAFTLKFDFQQQSLEFLRM